MPRRTPGVLLPIEQSILAAGIEARREGRVEFHGFAIAGAIQEREGSRKLTAHGTLYRALARLEDGGLLESRWEDPDLAVRDGRPRRRLYQVTGLGEAALTRSRADLPASSSRPRLASS